MEMSGKTITQPKWLDRVRNEMREAIFINKERETALNTYRLHCVVSHLSRLFRDNTIFSVKGSDRSANEPQDFTSIIFLFFCSFTDKIFKS
jgi:hypothetical protein